MTKNIPDIKGYWRGICPPCTLQATPMHITLKSKETQRCSTRLLNVECLFTNEEILEKIISCNKIGETFLLPTDAHNVKKHRVIKTF